jgi:RNA polymerase sigma factor (TIGR02999 family)
MRYTSFFQDPNVAPSSEDDFAELLRRAQAGDPNARERLVASLYKDLHAIAHRRMRRERPGHTLQTSDLVHEALKRILSDQTLRNAVDRTFLYRAASQAMERVLIDHHRRRSTSKGPGRLRRTPLDDVLDHLADVERIPFHDLHEALQVLEGVDARAVLVVRFHFFLGMSQPEVAETLGISQKTVERDWKFARGWLRTRLKPEGDA